MTTSLFAWATGKLRAKLESLLQQSCLICIIIFSSYSLPHSVSVLIPESNFIYFWSDLFIHFMLFHYFIVCLHHKLSQVFVKQMVYK
jgi:hypothetical protein